VYASAGNPFMHVEVVGDLAALLGRLTARLPGEWGQYAATRFAEQLGKGSDPAAALTVLLHLQTLIAAAIKVPREDRDVTTAAAEAYRASQQLLAALIAPSPTDRQRALAEADVRLAAAHASLAAHRSREAG